MFRFCRARKVDQPVIVHYEDIDVLRIKNDESDEKKRFRDQPTTSKVAENIYSQLQ